MFKKSYISILVVFCRLYVGLYGQDLKIEKQTWDFGTVNFWKNDTAWFKVRNESNKTLMMLPTHYNQNFRLIRNVLYADKGETIEIGIVYYTDHTGKFNVKVPVYFNLLNEPLNFTLRGEIKHFDPAALVTCPKVNEGPPTDPQQKIITIEVRDLHTDVQLQADKLFVTDHENHKVKLEKSGMDYEMSVPPGQYRIVCNKTGYEDYSSAILLEPYKDRFIVYLERANEPNYTPIEKVVDSTLISHKEKQDRVKDNREEKRDTLEETEWLEENNPHPHVHPEDTMKHMEHIDTIKHLEKPDTWNIVKKTEPEGFLDSTKYKYNNIILIVDISGSMKRDSKLDFLKAAMGQTFDVFRSEDIVGIVALNANAAVIQQPEKVLNKDTMQARVQRMKAEGATNGGGALQMAYQLAMLNYKPDANNQIVICTDGVFSSGNMLRRDLEKMIADKAIAGVHLSAVGIGKDEKAMLFLEHLTDLGKGSFIQISNVDETDRLLQMVKSQCLK